MRIALIGLGEVGRVLAEELVTSATLSVWDVGFADPLSRATGNAHALGLAAATSAREAVVGAEVVISAVTAANDVAAARSAAAGVDVGAFFLDLNSAAPQSKQTAAAAFEAAGGRYVEAAVMSPIEPKRLAAPILLGGPHAKAFTDIGAQLGFTGLRVYSDGIGPAAATKLCRSVVVKGLETLLLESMIAARQWGVEDEVLASLSNIVPGADWPELARYMLSRAVQHGARRAQEMDEAAVTVEGAGLEPILAGACARRQAWAAQFGTGGTVADAASVADIVDAINQQRTVRP